MFRVQMDEAEYRLVGPAGEEGSPVEYGSPAALAIGAAIYYSLVSDPDAQTADVYRVDQVTAMDASVEEVEFEYPDDEEEEEGEEDATVIVDEPGSPHTGDPMEEELEEEEEEEPGEDEPGEEEGPEEDEPEGE